eukprot:6475495-Amphidinium_carterae.2
MDCARVSRFPPVYEAEPHEQTSRLSSLAKMNPVGCEVARELLVLPPSKAPCLVVDGWGPCSLKVMLQGGEISNSQPGDGSQLQDQSMTRLLDERSSSMRSGGSAGQGALQCSV